MHFALQLTLLYIGSITDVSINAINPDYSIEKCCKGCLCPGDGDMKGTIEAYIVVPNPTKDDSHGFGPIIMAMLETDKNGIENIVK